MIIKAAIKKKAVEVVEATHYPTCLEDEFEHDRRHSKSIYVNCVTVDETLRPLL